MLAELYQTTSGVYYDTLRTQQAGSIVETHLTVDNVIYSYVVYRSVVETVPNSRQLQTPEHIETR